MLEFFSQWRSVPLVQIFVIKEFQATLIPRTGYGQVLFIEFVILTLELGHHFSHHPFLGCFFAFLLLHQAFKVFYFRQKRLISLSGSITRYHSSWTCDRGLAACNGRSFCSVNSWGTIWSLFLYFCISLAHCSCLCPRSLASRVWPLPERGCVCVNASLWVLIVFRSSHSTSFELSSCVNFLFFSISERRLLMSLKLMDAWVWV